MRSIQSLLFTAVLVLAAPAAWAVTFDFATFAIGNEQGYDNSAPFTMTVSGVTVTATAFDTQEGDPASHVYLDGLSSGLPAGMGVCKELDGGGECDPSSDDNLSQDERLVLEFNSPVSLDLINFRDCDHTLTFDCEDADDLPNGGGGPIFQMAVDGGLFTSSALGSSFAPGLVGTSFEFRYENEKYYISLMEVTPETPPIPEPATLSLLGTGLLVAGLRAKRRRG